MLLGSALLASWRASVGALGALLLVWATTPLGIGFLAAIFGLCVLANIGLVTLEALAWAWRRQKKIQELGRLVVRLRDQAVGKKGLN